MENSRSQIGGCFSENFRFYGGQKAKAIKARGTEANGLKGPEKRLEGLMGSKAQKNAQNERWAQRARWNTRQKICDELNKAISGELTKRNGDVVQARFA